MARILLRAVPCFSLVRAPGRRGRMPRPDPPWHYGRAVRVPSYGGSLGYCKSRLRWKHGLRGRIGTAFASTIDVPGSMHGAQCRHVGKGGAGTRVAKCRKRAKSGCTWNMAAMRMTQGCVARGLRNARTVPVRYANDARLGCVWNMALWHESCEMQSTCQDRGAECGLGVPGAGFEGPRGPPFPHRVLRGAGPRCVVISGHSVHLYYHRLPTTLWPFHLSTRIDRRIQVGPTFACSGALATHLPSLASRVSSARDHSSASASTRDPASFECASRFH